MEQHIFLVSPYFLSDQQQCSQHLVKSLRQLSKPGVRLMPRLQKKEMNFSLKEAYMQTVFPTHCFVLNVFKYKTLL